MTDPLFADCSREPSTAARARMQRERGRKLSSVLWLRVDVVCMENRETVSCRDPVANRAAAAVLQFPTGRSIRSKTRFSFADFQLVIFAGWSEREREREREGDGRLVRSPTIEFIPGIITVVKNNRVRGESSNGRRMIFRGFNDSEFMGQLPNFNASSHRRKYS